MTKAEELRQALDVVEERFATAYARPPRIEEVIEAARERLAQLESDALVIQQDENGEWPAWFREAFEALVLIRAAQSGGE